MSNTKEILNQLKVILGMEKTKENFEKVPLLDGTALEISILDVGGVPTIDVGCVVTKEDGSPIEDGKYVLEDGDILVIVDGKITEIKNVELPETETKDENEMADVSGETPAETDKVAELEARLDEMSKKLDELASMFSKEKEEFGKIIEKINLEPSVQPINFSKVEEKPLTEFQEFIKWRKNQ